MAPDGGYGEGPYYAHYILGYLGPFSVHLANTMDISLFAHPYLERMVNWVLDNEKGSGQYTQFDDSYEIRNFYLPLIVSQANSGIYWDTWLDSQPEFPQYNANMIEALAAYREFPVRKFRSPFFPGKFYADMGQVILKDRQIAPGFFVSLVDERERWFADVHEQIDPFSFELSALAEDWIIDGGYGGGTGDPNRDYFISPQANSTVLVDGYGTDPNPLVGDEPGGRLDYGFSTPQFAAAGLSHVIGDVYLTRHLFYAGGNHVIVFDQMDGGTPHSYTVQYNYLGNFEDQGNGNVRIGKNGKQLNIHLLADDVADWRVRQNRGLATGRQGVFGHSVVQFESETQPNANGYGKWGVAPDSGLQK
ncbi:MAG: heparinase II/III family protein [Calditrichia bacterium]